MVAAKKVTVVKEVITKDSPQAIVGLTIGDKHLPNGTTVPVISKVSPEGLCDGTTLQPGMRVLTINGIACRGREDTFAMLRMGQGDLTIVAGPITMVAATVTKPTAETKVGFSMKAGTGKGKDAVVVSKVAPTGLFNSTDLKAGMRVHSIDDVDMTGLTLEEVIAIVVAAKGCVTVLAEAEAPPPKRPSQTRAASVPVGLQSSSSTGGSRRNLDGSQRSLGDSLRNIGSEMLNERKATRRRSSLRAMEVPKNSA